MTNLNGRAFLIVAVVVFVLISACTNSPSTISTSPEEIIVIDSMILTIENNETAVTVKPGEPFIVQLDGNITTGYAWEVDEIDSAFLKQVSEVEYRKKTLILLPMKS